MPLMQKTASGKHSICRVPHCPALQRPRIAVHHGIWRELHMAISRWSTEKNKKDDNLKWFFPSAVSDSNHDEWTFRHTVVHLGLVDRSNLDARKEFRRNVAEYHLEEKDFVKNLRYENHISFLEEYSKCKLGRLRWSCTQANFTVGVRGSIKNDDFDTRLAWLVIPEKKVRQVIAVRTVRKTLELSHVILSIFHLSIRTNPEWAKHAVSDMVVNTSTVRYNLFKTFTGPTSGFGI